MQTYRPRTLDPTKILTRRELATVLADLKRKAPRAEHAAESGCLSSGLLLRPARQRDRTVARG